MSMLFDHVLLRKKRILILQFDTYLIHYVVIFYILLHCGGIIPICIIVWLYTQNVNDYNNMKCCFPITSKYSWHINSMWYCIIPLFHYEVIFMSSYEVTCTVHIYDSIHSLIYLLYYGKICLRYHYGIVI